MATFEKDCGVCGYHVYQRVWDAANGETLTCGRELTNKSDRYAVAVMKDSRDCYWSLAAESFTCLSLFLKRGGTITCEVTGTRRYSVDLPCSVDACL